MRAGWRELESRQCLVLVVQAALGLLRLLRRVAAHHLAPRLEAAPL